MKKYLGISKMESAALIVAAVLLCWMIFSSCGIDNGDFTDTKMIETIVKNDAEEVFGVDVADDSIPTTTYTKAILKDNSTLAGLRFGRVITTIDKQVDVTIIQPNLAAEATLTFTLNGLFVRDSNGTLTSKPLTHKLTRLVSLEKKENGVTKEKWRRTSTSAAYGKSGNILSGVFADSCNLVLDSLLILTPRDTIVITDPLEFAFYESHPIVLHQFETLVVEAKVRNSKNILDVPVGFISIGRNKARTVKSKDQLVNLGLGHFARSVTVGFTAQPHFSQLVVDFVTLSTIASRTKPYDSFLIFIPIRIE
jgi:hypothetical protein